MCASPDAARPVTSVSTPTLIAVRVPADPVAAPLGPDPPVFALLPQAAAVSAATTVTSARPRDRRCMTCPFIECGDRPLVYAKPVRGSSKWLLCPIARTKDDLAQPLKTRTV